MKMFVYGTLKKGFRNHHYLQNADYLCNATLHNYELFSLVRYPGIAAKDGAMTEGEVYEVDEAIKACVDELEEEGSLYKCVWEDVICEDGTIINASVYVYLHPQEAISYEGNSWKQKYKRESVKQDYSALQILFSFDFE